MPARRRTVDVITVAHPDRGGPTAGKALEQPPALHPHVGPTVLAPRRTHHTSTGQMGQQLHPVAEPEYRRPEGQQVRMRRRHTISVHRIGPSRENDPFRLPRPDPGDVARRGVNLAIHTLFPHPPCDELGVLRTEVDDQDAVGMTHGDSAVNGSAISSRKSSVRRSRGRTTAQRPVSTSTSAARALLL